MEYDLVLHPGGEVNVGVLALVGGGWAQNYLSSASATAPGTWRATSASVVFGHSVRFVVTNRGTEEGVFSARIQLLG
ncbi:MAG: hypothetical protein K6U00_06415 [Armatimonadetes bacterium]|nr:hypothetical protein [Armatimonadota bacterium]